MGEVCEADDVGRWVCGVGWEGEREPRGDEAVEGRVERSARVVLGV